MLLRAMLALAIGVGSAATSQAATWNAFYAAAGQDYIIFFDHDTVLKNGEQVTLWLKYVYDVQVTQNDGVYSFASRSVYKCKQRTFESLTTSQYAKDGAFLRTLTGKGVASDIVPGSNGETLLGIVCAQDFPNNKSGEKYGGVLNNDPLQGAAAYFDYMRAKKADPAPQ